MIADYDKLRSTTTDIIPDSKTKYLATIVHEQSQIILSSILGKK